MHALLLAPVLQAFQDELLRIYGDKLVEIILYGSYARGDFNENSDVDLLLLFEDKYPYFQQDSRVYNSVVQILSEHQQLISLMPVYKTSFETYKTPLYQNIKREGIRLWTK
jgi:uncharacterized protein